MGCGNGRLFSLLKDRGVEYIGIDSSEKLIDIAKSKYWKENPKFLVVEALHLPFPDNYFDKIYSIAVLHHIPSDAFRLEFLKEVKRVLKPKGFFILTAWNLRKKKAGFWLLIKYTILGIFGKSKLDQGDVFYSWKTPEGKTVAQRYLHCFKKRELETLVGKAGFKIKEAGFIPRGSFEEANIYLIAEKTTSPS